MTDPEIIAIVRRQHGLITFEQALRRGLTPHRVRSLVRRGDWVPVARRLYRAAVVPVTFEQRVLGACLLSGADAMASHMTAAALEDLDGARPGRVEISIRRGRTHHNPIAVVHQLSVMPRPVRIGGIPVTPVPRTLIDVAARLPEPTFTRMLDDALVRGKTTPDLVRAAVAEMTSGPRRAGIRRVVDALEVWTPGPRPASVPEIELARLIAAAGYGVPERQVEIFDRSAKLVGRVDLALRAARIAFEYYGADGHTPRTELHDRAREHGIIAAGWHLLVATKHTFGGGRARFLRALDQKVRVARAA